MNKALVTIVIPLLALSCQLKKEVVPNPSRVAVNSEGLVLHANLITKDNKCLLKIKLSNSPTAAMRVPELNTNTLILADKDGSHVGLASNPAAKDKIVVLEPGETISKQFEFPRAQFTAKELYLTHYTRFKDIEYEPLKAKVANKSFERMR